MPLVTLAPKSTQQSHSNLTPSVVPWVITGWQPLGRTGDASCNTCSEIHTTKPFKSYSLEIPWVIPWVISGWQHLGHTGGAGVARGVARGIARGAAGGAARGIARGAPSAFPLGLWYAFSFLSPKPSGTRFQAQGTRFQSQGKRYKKSLPSIAGGLIPSIAGWLQSFESF